MMDFKEFPWYIDPPLKKKLDLMIECLKTDDDDDKNFQKQQLNRGFNPDNVDTPDTNPVNPVNPVNPKNPSKLNFCMKCNSSNVYVYSDMLFCNDCKHKEVIK